MTFSVIPTFQTIKGSYLKESANVSEWTSRQDCFIAVLSCVVWHRVMESLNLLRYLVIRDKVTDNQVSRPANIRGDQKQQYWTMVWFTSFITLSAVLQTGIWTELYKIEDTFLKPLRVGVNMSRAHYERELHDTRATKRGKAKGQNTTRLFFFFLQIEKLEWKLHVRWCYEWRIYECVFHRGVCDFCVRWKREAAEHDVRFPNSGWWLSRPHDGADRVSVRHR